MKTEKTFAWWPFAPNDCLHDYADYTANWGQLLPQDHLMIDNGLTGWRKLINCQHKPVTLYVLGHGSPGDALLHTYNTSKTKSAADLYDEMCRYLNSGMSFFSDVIEKIKFYQCSGGLKGGLAHEFRKLLPRGKADIEIYGYLTSVYTPSATNYTGKWADDGLGGLANVKAKSKRFQPQPEYGDVYMNLGTIRFDTDEHQENQNGKFCCV